MPEVLDADEMSKLINGEPRACEIGDLEAAVNEEADGCGLTDVEDRDFMDAVDVTPALLIPASNC